jgi:thiosulfate/3-mercaptopyruvate sulfurtransferase
MDPIVSPEWLADHRDDVAVVHVGTTMSGADPADAFMRRHIAGAVFVSLDDDLADPPGPVIGRHPLPDAARFAAAMAEVGVGDETPVVAYDERGGAFASRLVWMLRIVGQPAALLDGGIAAWNGPFESGSVVPDPAERAPTPWPPLAVADADDVEAHIAAGGIVIDSREPGRYRGEHEPIDHVAGHVPGAINLPFSGNLVDGRFRNPDELRQRFEALHGESIVYCGSGVTACHNALAIESSGLPAPRVYVGSWSGWSTDPTRGIAITE